MNPELSLNILIVEDEINLGDTLKDYLCSKGYNVFHSSTASCAKEQFSSKSFNLVLMDINLPDGNGIDLAKEFRDSNKNFVLLFLSAQNDPETKYRGLELGAEDYITKPFDLRELNLRLSRIFSTQEVLKKMESEITIGDIKILFSQFLIIRPDGSKINLSQKECSILQILYTNKETVISRDQIIEQVWGKDSFPSNRTVDNYIVKLRKSLETNHNESCQINSIRGVGYSLNILKENV